MTSLKGFFAALAFFLIYPLFAEPSLKITRDGKIFTVQAWVEIDRPACEVWPYMWEFRYLSEYFKNCTSIDSLSGTDGRYNVRFVADYPFLHTEITNHKWIIQEGTSVGTRTIKSEVKSPLPLAFLDATGFWKLYPLGDHRCKVYFKNQVKIDAAGMEFFYIPIARRDGRATLQNFKEYVESNCGKP